MRDTILVLFCIIIGTSLAATRFAGAESYPISEMPPKVNVSETNVNVTVSRANGTLWATIDAEYKMHTVYAYGDSYLAENTGMGLVLYPNSPYIMLTVTQDALEAHYPVPVDATNISVRLNGEKVIVQPDAHGYFHIFDTDLPEINWTVWQVPDDFIVAIHYEHPVSETPAAYTYLGRYAFTLPFYGRFGCSNISYPLYSWYGYPPNNYNIKIESNLLDLQVYSVDTRGTLTPLNLSLASNEGIRAIAFSNEDEASSVHGVVMVFDPPSEEDGIFPIVWVIAAIAAITILALAVFILYFVKRRKRGQQT